MERHKYTTEDIVEAVEKSLGILSTAAKRLGVHRKTLHTWIKEEPALKQALEEAEWKYKDFIETQVVQLVRDKDPATVRWAASRKLRDRGYGDKIVIQNEKDITEDLSQLTEEQLNERVAKLRERLNSAI